MRTVLLLLLSTTVFNLSFSQETEEKSLSKDKLKVVYEKYEKTMSQVFCKGSEISDVDKLYSFYTDDFEYNHPKYGGIYSRELLYSNTIKYLEKGAYDNSSLRERLSLIVGLDAVIVEWKYENKSDKKVTLYKFRGDKIYYVEEFW